VSKRWHTKDVCIELETEADELRCIVRTQKQDNDKLRAENKELHDLIGTQGIHCKRPDTKKFMCEKGAVLK